MGRLIRLLRLGAERVGQLLFVVMFGAFLLQIVSRYALPDPLPWTDEVALIAFLWLVFWVGGLLLRDSDQVRFDIVAKALPPGGQRVLAILGHLLVAGLFGAALPTILDYIAFLWREKTPVLLIPLDWVYACFGLALVAIVLRALKALAGLLGPRWRERL
ncbi:MAG TPA: TRAP transporter small permease [Alphaproteobacteria bacterium]|jgi:TRAP-type C4-dicarboxylate transport system permease small subunit|nr:TRAP transporter small permease [Alphaproteobacteria bacterium]